MSQDNEYSASYLGVPDGARAYRKTMVKAPVFQAGDETE